LPGTATIAKVLLKARPTPAQLADRFAEPVPEGLELYLDAEYIKDRGEMGRLAEQLAALRPNPDFVYVVEGPLRSLDGEFFDLSVNSPANRECLRRISTMAELIGAEAVLVHAITPMVLETDDIVATFAQLKANGVHIVDEPKQQPWGWWGVFADQDGNTYGVHQ
jgi:hypothetical protein